MPLLDIELVALSIDHVTDLNSSRLARLKIDIALKVFNHRSLIQWCIQFTVQKYMQQVRYENVHRIKHIRIVHHIAIQKHGVVFAHKAPICAIESDLCSLVSQIILRDGSYWWHSRT